VLLDRRRRNRLQQRILDLLCPVIELGAGIVEVLFEPMGDIVLDMPFEPFVSGKEEGGVRDAQNEQYGKKQLASYAEA
jgi:hypothetical protein